MLWLHLKMLSILVSIFLIFLIKEKQLKWQQTLVIISVPFISFAFFQRSYNLELDYQNKMLSKPLNTDAKFITTPIISEHTLSGKLQIDNDYFQYYFKTNRKIMNDYVSALNGRSCKIYGNFKSNGEGIDRKLYINLRKVDLSSCKSTPMQWMSLLEIHKQYIYHRLVDEHIDDPGKIIAMITGDTSKIEEKQLEHFREVGIYHLLAISGTHVTALVGIIFYTLNKFKCPIFFIKGIIFALLPLYAIYTGMVPSALRAVLMTLIFLLLPKKLYNQSINILCVVFVLLTLISPQIIYNIGFQFSFFITFCILFSIPIFKGAHIIKSTIFISIIAQLSSFIISAVHFNQIQWIGIIANLFFVPFYTFLLFPITLIYFVALHFPFKLIPLTKCVNALIFIHDDFISIFMKFSTFKWYTPELSTFYIAIAVFLIFVALIIFVHKRYILFLIILVLLFFIVTILPKSTDYRLTMLNVNQGDAILFETDKQESVLIDTGGILTHKGEANTYTLSKRRILPTLKKHGLTKINYLIITHPHVDHMGELSYLMEKYQFDHIIINANSFSFEQLKRLSSLCKIYQTKLLDFKTINHLVLSKANIRLLDATIQNSDDLNEHSIITYIQYNQFKILLMGDASIHNESLLLNKYKISNLDILKVGHHGSKTSSSANFLKLIHPKISLISVGQNNRYKLPNIELINRLKAIRSKIYMTSQSGEVTITLSQSIRIKSQYHE